MYNDNSIAYFRKKQGLTQKEIADRIGIKRYYYSMIETKTIIPNTKIAERISFQLEVPIGLLWTKEELNYISFKSKGKDGEN